MFIGRYRLFDGGGGAKTETVGAMACLCVSDYLILCVVKAYDWIKYKAKD